MSKSQRFVDPGAPFPRLSRLADPTRWPDRPGFLPPLAGGTFESAIPAVEAVVALVAEAERGVLVEPPTAFVPVMVPKYKPDLKYLEDDAFRGSMVKTYNMIPGLRYDSLGWDQYLYMDTVPNLIRALLGSKDTKTAAPATTELVKEAKAGDTKILTKATLAEGSYVVIGKAGGVGQIETHKTGKPKEVKAEEWEIPLVYPLAFAQPNATKVEGLTKHEFSLLNNTPTEGNQPPSYSLYYFSGEEKWRALRGAQLDNFSLSGTADTLPKAAVQFMSFLSQTPVKTTAELNALVSFSTAQAAPGWNFVAAVGGEQITNVEEWSLDMKRSVKPIPAITGNENYYQMFASYLEITGKLKVLANQKSPLLQAYLKGETKSLDFTISDVNSGYAMNLHSTEMKFPQGEIDASKEWFSIPLEVKPIPSSSDALAGGVSPIKVTVANATATEY